MQTACAAAFTNVLAPLIICSGELLVAAALPSDVDAPSAPLDFACSNADASEHGSVRVPLTKIPQPLSVIDADSRKYGY